jgi:hypothetical protein
MADRYIDYFEVGEYGDHFVSEIVKLDGLSTIVNVQALRDKVQSAVAKVDAELAKAGITRSGVRTGRDTTTAAVAAAKDLIERFYYHLLAQPKSAGIDVEAFYPGKNLGSISELKPADLGGKLAGVLRGFDAPANVAAAGALGSWQADLTAAIQALAAAEKGKGGARGDAINATADLAAAREDFLRVYNKVAKKAVQALLAVAARVGEYELFFKDLQVNEDGTPKKKAAAAPAKPGG